MLTVHLLSRGVCDSRSLYIFNKKIIASLLKTPPPPLVVGLVGRTYEEKLAESGLATLKDRWIDLIDRFSSYFLNPHRI